MADKSPLLGSFNSMRTRCYNPRRKQWKDYGGRGIKVCVRWASLKNFEEDMAESWFPGATLERLDVNGDYNPDNCIWVPRAFQSKNRRKSVSWQFSNRGIKTNTSGLRGVCWDKARGRWLATICIERKQKNLGRFGCPTAAHFAYLRAAKKLRGD